MLGKFYAKVLPMFAAWLNDLKGTGDCNNKTVSRWLLYREAAVMEEVAKAIRAKGIRCISAHDGIDVDPDFAWQAERIFRETCVKHGLPPNITSK